jgi:F-type H+-transporting ATPase subunit a
MKKLIGTLVVLGIIVGSNLVDLGEEHPPPGAPASALHAELPHGTQPAPQVTEAHQSPEHFSLVHWVVPDALMHNLRGMFGPSLKNQTSFPISHVFMGALVLGFGIFLAARARRRLRTEEDLLYPPKRFGAVAFFDIVVEWLLGTMEQLMPRDKALRALPLVTAFFVFILLSNLLGLVPFFLPATDNLNTTLALALTSFAIYIYYAIRTHGVWGFLKHLWGPVWYLGPLIFFIEALAHFAVRPGSLALRLLGNMFGDHMVLGAFLAFHMLLIPIPIILLGLLVCVVQALVFSLLTIVYIALAVEEHVDHEEHAPAAHAAHAN